MSLRSWQGSEQALPCCPAGVVRTRVLETSHGSNPGQWAVRRLPRCHCSAPHCAVSETGVQQRGPSPGREGTQVQMPPYVRTDFSSLLPRKGLQASLMEKRVCVTSAEVTAGLGDTTPRRGSWTLTLEGWPVRREPGRGPQGWQGGIPPGRSPGQVAAAGTWGCLESPAT